MTAMRIHDALKEAQDGRALTNLARAFHLPPEKVDIAVDAALSDLVAEALPRLHDRNRLAGLVDLLGQSAYEQVLDTPVLLGATHTQVLGTDALRVMAGRGAADTISGRTAAAAEISEMISEYLLPVVAAMVLGALARLSGHALESISQGLPADADPGADPDARRTLHLPRASGGVGFSGSTGGSVGFKALVREPSRYAELAELIEHPERKSGVADPVDTVRNTLSACLTGSDQAADRGAASAAP